MSHLTEALTANKVYQSNELRDWIISTENSFNIVSAKEKYHNLVNFSTNVKVPYHQWFIYREGFARQLIETLLDMSDLSGNEFVIDPFCGSGTTNVVSALRGHNTLGIDVNPMSAFITQAKISHYSDNDLAVAEQYLSGLDSFDGDIDFVRYSSIEKYFTEENFRGLSRIAAYIRTLPESLSRTILKVAFDSIVMDSSDRKRDGNGLKPYPTKVADVYEYFSRKVNLIIEDIKSERVTAGVNGFGVFGSVLNMSDIYFGISDSKAGAVIFSPPYPNSFDYFESYKLELVFGDYVSCIREINNLRSSAVRSFIGAKAQESCDKYVDMIAQEIEDSIPEKEALNGGKRDSRTRRVPNMIRGYFADMHETIRQCNMCLRKGGKTFIVVDESAYLGKIVPTDLIIAKYGEEEGFKVNQIIECRTARTSGQQLNRFPYLKTAIRESIIELEKI